MIYYLLAAIAFISTTAAAGYAASPKSELQGIKKEIQQKQQLIKTTAKIEKKVSGELAVIDRNLKEKEQNLKALGLQLREVETSIGKTMAEADRVRIEAERKREEIRRRLVALYKGGDLGAARIYFSSDSLPQMVEGIRYMNSVVQNDRKMVDDYNRRIDELQELKKKLEADARKKESIKGAIEEKKEEVEAEKKKKADYLVQVRQDKKSYMASLKELQANARRLQAMVEKLEAMSRRRYTAKVEKPAPGRKPAEPVVSYSGKGIGTQKGQLALPVKGPVTGTFGKHKHPEFNSYTVSNGISIAAPQGAEIHSIADGKVIFSNYFKGYGNMIIVDHGEGYFSLYAHASRLGKKEGATVSRNEVIASVGDVDSPDGSKLYFEIRYQGRPVDPGQWFR